MRTIGSYKEVFNGEASHTSGGLTRDKLTLNKRGKVVSKARSEASRARYPALKAKLCEQYISPQAAASAADLAQFAAEIPDVPVEARAEAPAPAEVAAAVAALSDAQVDEILNEILASAGAEPNPLSPAEVARIVSIGRQPSARAARRRRG